MKIIVTLDLLNRIIAYFQPNFMKLIFNILMKK